MDPVSDQPAASFVLIPGAGGMGWYWQRVLPLLQDRQHEAIAVDLPGDDQGAGLNDYADIVVRAIGGRSNVVLVAHSLGGFTAPLVCARAPIRMLVFVNAMIPQPGETAAAWWQNTGAPEARVAAAGAGGYSAEFDLPTYFLHDVPEVVLGAGPSDRRAEAEAMFNEAEAVFNERCGFEGWPPIPIRVIVSADDRFFPVKFQRRIALDRLHVNADVVAGGHLVALSNPRGLVDLLLRLEREAA